MFDLLAEMLRHGFGHEQFSADRLRECFHTTGFIDCGTNHREVEPIRRADIAKKYFTFVQDNPNLEECGGLL